MFNTKEEVKTLLEMVSKEDVGSFLGDVEVSGDIVWHVSGNETVFDGNPIFDRNLKRPFFEALEFLEHLKTECENLFD